jgi:hypothetical protein
VLRETLGKKRISGWLTDRKIYSRGIFAAGQQQIGKFLQHTLSMLKIVAIVGLSFQQNKVLSVNFASMFCIRQRRLSFL